MTDNPLLVLADHAASWRHAPDAGRGRAPCAPRADRLVRRPAAGLPGAARDADGRRAWPPSAGRGGAICYVDGSRGADAPRRADQRHAPATRSSSTTSTATPATTRAARPSPRRWPPRRRAAATWRTCCAPSPRATRCPAASASRCSPATTITGTPPARSAPSARRPRWRVLLGLRRGADRACHRHRRDLGRRAAAGLPAERACRSRCIPGHAAEAGALAAIGAAAGMTGALDVLHGPTGFAAATSEDTGKWEKALAGLGERFAITAMTFKNHGCCGHIFAALDAVRDLQARARLRAGGRREDRTSAATARPRRSATAPSAATEQDCRFSVQYTVGGAADARRRAASRPSSPRRSANPAIRAHHAEGHRQRWMPELAAAFPAKRAAKVAIGLKDGRAAVPPPADAQGRPGRAAVGRRGVGEVPRAGRAGDRRRGGGALLDGLWRGRDLPGAVQILANSRHRAAAE